jgi:hypothetical protein
MMLKNYFYTILVLFCFASGAAFAQDSRQPGPAAESLSFYPNPVNNGKIYITSKTTLDKEVLIFDVLGKMVLHKTITTKELSIDTLFPGVYIIKLKEGDNTVTKKLIIK